MTKLAGTRVSIWADAFRIDDRPTYAGRLWEGCLVEGLLLNARMVQATFDDLNPATVPRWAYPDTLQWDAERNTTEFVAAMGAWRRCGLLAVTLNLQGGSPEGYSGEQPWHNSAFRADGSLRPPYLARLGRVIDRADQLGMAVILGLFYFGQDERLRDESAVLRAVDNAVDWLLDRDCAHVLVEVNNECDVPRYEHAVLRPERVHELLWRVRRRAGGRLLVSTSYGGGTVARENVVAEADFVLMHGNGVSEPARLAEMVHRVRQLPAYRPMPIVINEDDHFDFDHPANNMRAAIEQHCSWGYFDPGANDYANGYQSPPVRWGINTPRQRAFFRRVAEVAGVDGNPPAVR
ncbi:MAG: hypothetical protein ABIL09_15965 [Gemmatimonadota bacterium]